MNIAIIFAGGTGQRMKSGSMPKQFLKVYNKPIIIYTLEHFYQHKEIDFIIVVCIKKYIKELQSELNIFGLHNDITIIEGGKTGQESIFRGLSEAKKMFTEDSIVLMHDGVRPFIDEETITNNIDTAKKFGNAITVSPAIETIIINNEGILDKVLTRDVCYHAKAPQTFVLKDIYNVHKKAQKDNFYSAIDSASLMFHYGYKLHTVIGSDTNIKITTQKDYYFMRALLEMNENKQLSLL